MRRSAKKKRRTNKGFGYIAIGKFKRDTRSDARVRVDLYRAEDKLRIVRGSLKSVMSQIEAWRADDNLGAAASTLLMVAHEQLYRCSVHIRLPDDPPDDDEIPF